LINVRNSYNGTTHGIYESLDGGDTWTITNFNPDNLNWGGLGTNNRIYKIMYHPTIPNLVFAGTSEGLFRSDNDFESSFLLFRPATRGNIVKIMITSNFIQPMKI